MDKSPTFGRYQKPSSGRRVRLIPSTPHPEASTPANSFSSTTDTIQSPETSPGESQSGIFKEVTGRVRLAGEVPYPFIYQTTNVGNKETIPSAPNSLEDTDSKEEEIGSDRAEGKEIREGQSVERNKSIYRQ